MKKFTITPLLPLAAALMFVVSASGNTPVRADDTATPPPPVVVQAQPSGNITWRGTVDDKVDINIQGSRVWTTVVTGHDMNDQTIKIFEALPADRVNVSLSSIEGRGSVRIIQQPDRDNGYTAVVRIHDPQSGRGFYKFSLTW